MSAIWQTLLSIIQNSGFTGLAQEPLYIVMLVVGCLLLYLAIVRGFEPLLLLPIAFGMILANLPGSNIIHMQYFIGVGDEVLLHPSWIDILNNGGLGDMLYMGVKLGIYPPLIFLGIGTMTDFGPLISNPKSLLLGAAAQLGIFTTFLGAKWLGFTGQEASSIGIIGGADGPTAIFVTSRLAPHLLGQHRRGGLQLHGPGAGYPAAHHEGAHHQEGALRRDEPAAHRFQDREGYLPHPLHHHRQPDPAGFCGLVGMLMLGNLMKESGVVDRIQKTAGNELMNIITIFLGVSVGCTTSANTFLTLETVKSSCWA